MIGSYSDEQLDKAEKEIARVPKHGVIQLMLHDYLDVYEACNQ